MSTNSFVGMVDGDKIIFVRCHFDGQPRHQHPLLVKYYNTKDDVETLINSGDIRSVGEHPDPYDPDGEPRVIAKSLFWGYVQQQYVSFVYLFDGEQWGTYVLADGDYYKIVSNEPNHLIVQSNKETT